MQKFFSKRPSLEEFVDTYKDLMLDDLEKVKQEEEFSQEEKAAIKAERHLSFVVLKVLLEANNNLSLEKFVRAYEKQMCENFEKVMQDDDISQARKDIIDDERRLSFEVLEELLADAETKEN